MIDLDENKKGITEFINNSISRFQTEYGLPTSIGIYCCPWSGWITTNFNIKTKLTETENNCPDFDFVEYDYMEIPEWEDEYESENPEFKTSGLVKRVNHDLGDEVFNKIIFDYLKPIVAEIKEQKDLIFLIQMLDSNFEIVL
ncbi:MULTISPECIES: hypothetical protein [Maribacter]|uniref:hypothetical protein n=1 Tax=Maribacter TaxID=252356 RepID=UPI002AB2A644|nr:hypothetical protein [Maribacter dokdonensis]